MRKTLLVATRNDGKMEELAELLADLDVEWVGLGDLEANGAAVAPVAETGATFRENAILKAEGYARQSGLLTLADDSGLEVAALGGAPGVHTARYGGEGLSSAERYRYLLAQMTGVPVGKRSARFCCVVAIAAPDGLLATAEGSVLGQIALQPSGGGGFGYDPVFVVDEAVVGQDGKTMAELPVAVKNQISHRALAIAAVKPALLRILDR
jgi:XTP/dITP diphosphohydrolase